MRVIDVTLCQNCNEIGALLSEIRGHERTGRYIFIYIDLGGLKDSERKCNMYYHVLPKNPTSFWAYLTIHCIN
jgi:hypothetical protein